MKKILVVEDSPREQRAVELILEGRAQCLMADTLREASRLFVIHWEELDAILVDGSVPPGNLERMDAAKWVRRLRGIGFEGDIIAFSANPGSQKRLMAAGCNKQFTKGKGSIDWFLALLNLPESVPSVH